MKAKKRLERREKKEEKKGEIPVPCFWE